MLFALGAHMATGDLKNNLRKLIAELKQARFSQDDLDVRGLAHGNPAAFLPILHYVFLDFSSALAQYFAEKDYELYGKTDLRFVEVVYRILRDEFDFKPSLTRGQFLSVGFAERKILLLSDILKFCREKDKQLNPKRGKVDRKEQRITAASKSERRDKPGEAFRKAEVLTEQNIVKNACSSREVLAGSAVLSKRRDLSSFENKENVESNVSERVCTGRDEVLPQPRKSSDLIIRTLSSQEGGMFKPVAYATAAGERSRHFRASKTVTWGDQVLAAQEVGENDEDFLLLQEQRHYRISSIGQPTALLSKTQGVAPNPEGRVWPVPVPSPWTVAPTPSDELILTPSGKAAHLPIPLSASRGYPTTTRADVSMVDITESVQVPQAQVTRHAMPCVAPKGEDFDVNSVPQSTQTSEEMFLLRRHVQELQVSLDAVVCQNNEMSARVVVLESKVKMLEESTVQRNVCSNCRRPDGNVCGSSSATDVEVVSGFRLQRPSSSREARCEGSIDPTPCPTSVHSISRRLNMEDTNHSTVNADHQGKITIRKPLVESPAKSRANTIFIDLASASQSMEESESPQQLPVHLATPLKTGKDSLEDSQVVLSPLETPDVSLAHLGSATKATVTNVHKRLKETREMLMRTNRDFAARFDHSQPES